jgi:hypothetical protein
MSSTGSQFGWSSGSGLCAYCFAFALAGFFGIGVLADLIPKRLSRGCGDRKAHLFFIVNCCSLAF